jgi:hypothetical protein
MVMVAVKDVSATKSKKITRMIFSRLGIA